MATLDRAHVEEQPKQRLARRLGTDAARRARSDLPFQGQLLRACVFIWPIEIWQIQGQDGSQTASWLPRANDD